MASETSGRGIRCLWLGGLIIALGCNSPLGGNAENDAVPEGQTKSELKDGEFALVVLNNRIVDGSEETEFVNSFPRPDEALIAEKVKSLNWNDPQSRPYVGLGGTVDGSARSMRLHGSLGAQSRYDSLRLSWSGLEGGVARHWQTPPLESPEAAIPVLVSFANQDDQWRTMVTWEDVPESKE